MKPIEYFKDKLAQEKGYDNWDDLLDEYFELANVKLNRQTLSDLEDEVFETMIAFILKELPSDEYITDYEDEETMDEDESWRKGAHFFKDKIKKLLKNA